MSYYGIGDDPRNRFRKLPRVKRSRSSVGNIRGGGSIGLPNRNQLMGAQPPAQRIPQRQQTGGGSSITTGPEQTPPEQEGLLGGLLQAKGAYEGVKEAATGGKNIRNAYNEFDSRKLDPRNWGTFLQGGSLPTLPVESAARFTGAIPGPRPVPQIPTGNVSGLTTTASPIGNTGMQGFSDLVGSNLASTSGSNLATSTSLGLGNAGTAGATSAQQLATAANSGPGAAGNIPAGINAGGATSVTKDGTKAVTGLKSPPTQGVDKLGVAGAGLGVGLNVHDISQNGLNFANATGLAGSAALGAAALKLGASNYWNPIGWTLLGASAADSIFDIF
jgi:hypothetical protein